jgi:hypothetical protein
MKKNILVLFGANYSNFRSRSFNKKRKVEIRANVLLLKLKRLQHFSVKVLVYKF